MKSVKEIMELRSRYEKKAFMDLCEYICEAFNLDPLDEEDLYERIRGIGEDFITGDEFDFLQRMTKEWKK